MLIALDIGTTNVKAVAFSDEGQVLAGAERVNRTLAPQPGWSEQEPEAVFQHVLDVLHEVLDVTRPTTSSRRTSAPASAIGTLRGIVFSSAMHGFVAVNSVGNPLTNILLWSDLRADAIARELRQPGGAGPEIYRRTGVPIHAMSPLTKIIWLRQNRPDVFQTAHKFLGIKEFVLARLCIEPYSETPVSPSLRCETGVSPYISTPVSDCVIGETGVSPYISDISCASATGLMNVHKNEWDEAALAMAGISTERLPVLVSPYHTFFLSEKNALRWGLPPDVPLIVGASDGACANLGSGAVQPGQVAVTIGTSAAIRTITSQPVLDEQMRTFCYRVDESRCIVGGASNNGTNVLEWLRTAVFQSPLNPEDFANQALRVPAGADGLRFLPHIHGERAPLWDAQARGSFQGLTAAHGQAHFVRAAMEGVLLNLKEIADALAVHCPIEMLYAGGGFSRNQLWVKMLADIFQKPVRVEGLPAEDPLSSFVETSADKKAGGVDVSALGAWQMGKAAIR